MEGLLPAHLINNVQFLDIVDKWFTRQNIAGLDLMPSTWRQVSHSPKVDQINKHNTVVHHHLRWVVGVLGCCCLLTCFLVDLFFIHFLLTSLLHLLSFADMIFEGVDSDKCFIHITLLVSFQCGASNSNYLSRGFNTYLYKYCFTRVQWSRSRSSYFLAFRISWGCLTVLPD